ncbi:hypothetical protein J6A31_05550 [bacterium]|nr:hypothetical protein [bacterium]
MSMHKKVLAGVLTLSLLPAFPSYAATTYASPADLVEDMVEVALTDVTSSTMDAAMAEMKGKITLSGDVVSYDGSQIGYWYSDASDYIYADSGRANTIVAPYNGDSWEVEPDFLEVVLDDINEDLVETIVPVGSDWSKIIGKYDVTLGDVTIPADQWYEIDYQNSTSPTVSAAFDFSSLTGINAHTLRDADEGVVLFSYAVSEGNLYVSQTLTHIYINNGSELLFCGDSIDTANAISGTFSASVGGTNFDYFPYIKVYPYRGAYAAQGMFPRVVASNLGSTVTTQFTNFTNISYRYLSNIANVSATLDYQASVQKQGIVWFTTTQLENCTVDSLHDAHVKFFTQAPESSRTVIGNSTLRRNLSKLSSLNSTDTVVLSDDGWTINGLTSIDDYLGEQILTVAGQSAVMNGVADVEQLNFRVIVPTTLPMKVDRQGTVTTATNAKIRNESNAAVEITDLLIEANPEGGWTLLTATDAVPSSTKGDNEFTFGTSLNIGDEIASGDNLPFTYNAKMSPPEDGIESIELVTVTVTFDWAS